MMPPFERELLRNRTSEIRRILDSLKGYPPDQMPEIVQQVAEESYLPALLRQIYTVVGVDIAGVAVGEFLNRKSAPDQSRVTWLMEDYVHQVSGEKIKSISGTLKVFIIGQIRQALETSPHSGIEQQTQYIHRQVLEKWDTVKAWQIRRIVHTETMQAMSVGQYEAMEDLGMEYRKVWTATFNNTRPEHEYMDGVTVGRDEFFILPNGDRMLYPHDTLHGASAENVINCQCGTYDYPIK